MLGGAGTNILRTNLIIHHSITDILGQVAKFSHVFSTVQEPRDLASLLQRDEVSENMIQFPSRFSTSDRPSTLESVELPFEGLPPFFFGLTLRNRHP